MSATSGSDDGERLARADRGIRLPSSVLRRLKEKKSRCAGGSV